MTPKSIILRRCVLATFALIATAQLHAANVRLYFVNPTAATNDTNSFIVQAIGSNVLSSGGVVTRGNPMKVTPNANGYATNTLALGWYSVSNKWLGRGVVIEVPSDSGSTVYDYTNLLRSGYNTYVGFVTNTVVTISTNSGVSASEVAAIMATNTAESATVASYVSGTLTNSITGSAATAATATNIAPSVGNITYIRDQDGTIIIAGGPGLNTGGPVIVATNGAIGLTVKTNGIDGTFIGTINSSTGYFGALSTPTLNIDTLNVSNTPTMDIIGNAATATAATSYPFKSVVAIGDSLTWSVGRYSYVYGLVTNHGFACLTNSGTSGNTAGQIVTNQLDLAKTFLGKQRASVLLWAGKNDQQYDNQFDPLPCVNTITNGLAAGIQRIWAMGADPVVMTLPHTYSDATYWPAFTNSESKTALVNQWLTNLPSNTNFLLGRTLTVVDVASAYPLSSYTNPPTGGGVLNSNVTYDGLHFSDAAKSNIASMVAAAISNSVAWQRPQTFGAVNLDVDSMSSNFVWMATNATATSATDTNAADWDAMNFIIAAQLTSPLEISAVHALVKRLKSDGNWNGLKVLYPFVGASSNSMSLNLRDITTYRLAFTGAGLTYTTNGISADGNSYGNTQFNPITAGLNTTNAHAFLWLKTQSSTNNTYYFGANGASSSNYRWFMRRDNSGTNTYGAGIGDATATTGSVTTNGAYMVQRVQTTNAQFWARYTKSEWASTATQLPDRELALFGYNTGSVGFLAGGTISGLAFGQAMSDTAASNFVNSWVVFQTTLGRQ